MRLRGAAGGPGECRLTSAYPNYPYPTFAAEVNAEDRARVESVRRGAASGFAAQSRLHPHEQPISDFIRYLATRLTPENLRFNPSAGS